MLDWPQSSNPYLVYLPLFCLFGLFPFMCACLNCFWVEVDLKRSHRNGLNEWMKLCQIYQIFWGKIQRNFGGMHLRFFVWRCNLCVDESCIFDHNYVTEQHQILMLLSHITFTLIILKMCVSLVLCCWAYFVCCSTICA